MVRRPFSHSFESSFSCAGGRVREQRGAGRRRVGREQQDQGGEEWAGRSNAGREETRVREGREQQDQGGDKDQGGATRAGSKAV